MLTKEKKKKLYKKLYDSDLEFSWDSETDVVSMVIDRRLKDLYDIVSYRLDKKAYEHCHETLLINKKRKHSILIRTYYDNYNASEMDERPFEALCFYSKHPFWRRSEWNFLVNVLEQDDNVTIGLSMIPYTTPDYNIVTGTYFTSLLKCKKFLNSRQTRSKASYNWIDMVSDKGELIGT